MESLDILELNKELLEAFSVLALKELCSYIDLDGSPVFCSWEGYQKYMENEFTKFKLTEEQFNIIVDYLTQTYKGKI